MPFRVPRGRSGLPRLRVQPLVGQRDRRAGRREPVRDEQARQLLMARLRGLLDVDVGIALVSHGVPDDLRLGARRAGIFRGRGPHAQHSSGIPGRPRPVEPRLALAGIHAVEAPHLLEPAEVVGLRADHQVLERGAAAREAREDERCLRRRAGHGPRRRAEPDGGAHRLVDQAVEAGGGAEHAELGFVPAPGLDQHRLRRFQPRPEVAILVRLEVLLDRGRTVVAVVVDDHGHLLDQRHRMRHEHHRAADLGRRQGDDGRPLFEDDGRAAIDLEEMRRAVGVSDRLRHGWLASEWVRL